MNKLGLRKTKKEQGFTLMELMVSIAIIAIASAITIPNMLGWLPNYRLSQVSSKMLSTFRTARLRAVKENANVVVRFDTDAHTFFAFADNGALAGDNIRQSDEPIVIQMQELPGKVTINSTSFAGDPPQIIFNPRGLTDSAGSVTFVNNNGLTQVVQVTLTGHSSIQ